MTEPRLLRPGKPGVPRTQHDRFIETALALGCDEDEAAFDEKLKAIVGPKGKGEQTEKKPTLLR